MKRTAITQSAEDYLEAIQVLIEAHGSAQVRDVASNLGVKMPSVVKAIRELTKMSFVTHEPYGDIRLTPEGQAVAQRVMGRHRLLREFLMKLGVGREAADRDACRMEHVLSDETLQCIRSYTKKNQSRKPKKARL